MAGADEKPKQTVASDRRKRKAKVAVLKVAKKEGRRFLNHGQYEHVTDVIKRLTDINDPRLVSDLRIEPVDNFYELKDKGGLLGKINVRIYFGHDQGGSEVIVVKAYKKEEEGQLPAHIILNVKARLRAYARGEMQDGLTIYEAKAA